MSVAFIEIGDRVWPDGNHRYATVFVPGSEESLVVCDCTTIFPIAKDKLVLLDRSTPITLQAIARGFNATSHGGPQ